MAEPGVLEGEAKTAASAGANPYSGAISNDPFSEAVPTDQFFSPIEPPARIASDQDYEALAPGKKFIDPTGKLRSKPYTVKDDAEFEQVPGGEQFVDPAGKLRKKPKYENLDFTPQTLFNMAANDRERELVLEKSYPGKVKRTPEGGFYVEDEGGVLRKPKGFMDAPGSYVAASAAPTIGSIGGEVLGGLAGAVTGPGVLATAIAGGAAGGAVGQTFNDAIMALSGTYDRSVGEQAKETGLAGAFGAAGTAVGRAVGAVAPSIKGAIREYLPSTVGKMLGAEAENVSTAAGLAEKGVLVPLSSWAKEAPHLQNLSEVLDPAFRTQQPLKQSAMNYYEKEGKELLDSMGVKIEGSLINPTAKPSTKEAGELLLKRATAEAQVADQRFAEELAKRQATFVATESPAATANQAILRSAEESRRAAQKVIDAGFQDIERDTAEAAAFSKAGHNGGDLWQSVGDKLQMLRRGIMERHEKWYNQASEAAGGIKPNTEGLGETATDFLAQITPEFKTQYPSIVRQIESLAPKVNPETGEFIKEATEPTWGQLHALRSQLRSNVDWYKLPHDLKDGAYKFFEKKVNSILHDPAAPEPLQLASRLLDATDRSYGENMAIFNARNIKAIMDGLRAGEPGDPKALFNAIVKEGHSDLTKKVLDMVGPNLASGIRAADVQSMLESSRSLIPGQIDGAKFVQEVLARHRSDMLTPIHGDEVAKKLLAQAQKIEAFKGRIDIAALPQDTALDIIARARTQAELAKRVADKDPLKVLEIEMKRMSDAGKKEAAAMRKERTGEPLGFLYNPTVGADAAVNKILNSEDLILAAAAKFGGNSSEFQALRQVWAERILTGTMKPGDTLAKISPETQQIMFPGVSLNQMKTLAKNMDFLLDTKAGQTGAGKSIMATEAVEHPAGQFFGKIGKILPKVPGVDFVQRSILTKYFAVVTELGSNPAFLRWLEKGLQGGPEAREMTRRELQRMMQKRGAQGAGAGEALFATPQKPQQ